WFDIAMNHVVIVHILHRATQLLHNGQSLHRRELPTQASQQILECAGCYKRCDHVEQPLTFTEFEKRQNVRVIELPNFFRLGHKIVAEGGALSIAWAEILHRY